MSLSVYDVYQNLWTLTHRAALKPMLQKVQVLRIPTDLELISKVDKNKTIVVLEKPSIYNSIQILGKGFSHCLAQERDDFPRELIISCLMILRPKALVDSEIPFFLMNDLSAEGASKENAIILSAKQSSEKNGILNQVGEFLEKYPKAAGMSDLAFEVMDEMFTNAFFNASIDTSQMNVDFKIERTVNVKLKAGSEIKVFAKCDETSLVIGCVDSFGSLKRKEFLEHMNKVYAAKKTTPQVGPGGAGLGFRMIVDNSTGIYVFCEQGKRTIVASAFILKGQKYNMNLAKHFHLQTFE